MFKLVLSFALFALCSAIYYDPQGQYKVDVARNHILVSDIQGYQVHFIFDRQYGVKDNILVEVRGNGQVMDTQEIRNREPVTLTGKYETDILYQIFDNFRGVVDEVTFEQLLHVVAKHVQDGQVHPIVLYTLQRLSHQDNQVQLMHPYHQQHFDTVYNMFQRVGATSRIPYHHLGFEQQNGDYQIEVTRDHIFVANKYGYKVHFVVDREYGVKDNIYVEVTKHGQVLNVEQIKQREPVTITGQYETDVLYQIFDNFRGYVDEATFQKLLQIVAQHVQEQRVHPVVLHSLQILSHEQQVPLMYPYHQQHYDTAFNMFQRVGYPYHKYGFENQHQGEYTPYQKYGYQHQYQGEYTPFQKYGFEHQYQGEYTPYQKYGYQHQSVGYTPYQKYGFQHQYGGVHQPQVFGRQNMFYGPYQQSHLGQYEHHYGYGHGLNTESPFGVRSQLHKEIPYQHQLLLN